MLHSGQSDLDLSHVRDLLRSFLRLSPPFIFALVAWDAERHKVSRLKSQIWSMRDRLNMVNLNRWRDISFRFAEFADRLVRENVKPDLSPLAIVATGMSRPRIAFSRGLSRLLLFPLAFTIGASTFILRDLPTIADSETAHIGRPAGRGALVGISVSVSRTRSKPSTR